jgi:hypothetical protein
MGPSVLAVLILAKCLSLLAQFFGIFCVVMPSTNKDSFISFISTYCLNAVARTSSMILNKTDERTFLSCS